MTFEERCARFEKNTEKETDIYKYVCRTVFLEKKKQEQKELEDSLFAIMLQENEGNKKERKNR